MKKWWSIRKASTKLDMKQAPARKPIEVAGKDEAKKDAKKAAKAAPVKKAAKKKPAPKKGAMKK